MIRGFDTGIRERRRKNVKNNGEDKNGENSFSNWCSITTCHGMYDWWNAPSVFLKIVWTVCILLCLSLLLQQLYQMLKNNPHSTNPFVSTEYVLPVNSKDKVPFPPLLLCSYTRIQKSRLEKYGVTKEMQRLMYSYTSSTYLKKVDNDNDQSAYIEYKAQMGRSYEQLWYLIGNTCMDFIIAIQYGKRLYSPIDICNNNYAFNVTRVLTSDMGLCLQIKFNESIVTAETSGQKNGITIILEQDVNEQIDWMENNYLDDGFAVRLGTGGEMAGTDWLPVSPTFHSMVAVARYRKMLNQPFLTFFEPPCHTNSKKRLRFYDQLEYSVSHCKIECNLEAIISLCKCVPWLTLSSNYAMCDPIDYMACSSKVKSEILVLASNDNYTNEQLVKSRKIYGNRSRCKQNCRPLCQAEGYKSEINLVKFPQTKQQKNFAAFMAQYTDRNTTISLLEGSIAALTIYYKTLDLIVEETYERFTLDQAISNIGGQLGLWAGISVLTIVQAIIYTLRTCCCTKRVNQVAPEKTETEVINEDSEATEITDNI